jgi:glycine betaine/choline ABC-type transport system substrate-binding protein
MRDTRRRHLRALLAVAAPLAACVRVSGPSLAVGAKSGVAEMLVAKAIGLHLESVFGRDRVAVRAAVGGTAVTHESLLARQIGMYAEYPGMALTTVLGLAPVSDPASVLAQVKANYRKRFRCEWVAPLGFSNQPVVAVMSNRSEAAGVATISSAANAPRPWRLGTTHEFLGRPDGMPLLMSAYNLPLSGAVQVLDVDDLYLALETGRVTMVVGEALDAGLRNPAFALLEDDRHSLPPQGAGIVVTVDALDRTPELLRTLQALTGRFSPRLVGRMVNEWTTAQAAAAGKSGATTPKPRDFAARLLGVRAANPAQ